MDVRVLDNPDRSRFEVRADGEVAGVADYTLGDRRMTVTHTEVSSEYDGQGLGSQLVRGALDTARERDLSVVPHCPFVRTYIERHPEYQDLLPSDQR